MCRPNLFVLGAPKCGTTSIASWLSEHPDVFMSVPKEPHFFSLYSGACSSPVNIVPSIENYECLFTQADAFPVVGEASTEYLLHAKSVVPEILRYSETPKFVVCIRDPVEMAISLHAERIFQGEENILDFECAWKLNDSRLAGQDLPPMAIDSLLSCYQEACLLGAQLNRLYELANNSSVFVVVLDDIKNDPRQVYINLLEFLEVRDDGKNDFGAENKRKYRKSRLINNLVRRVGRLKRRMDINKSFGLLNILDKWNKSAGTVNETNIDNSFKNDMRAAFYSDVLLLGQLVGRDLASQWDYGSQDDSHSRVAV